MNQSDIQSQLIAWMIDFVEKPNSLLGNWAPCPFARQARVNNKVGIYFLEQETVSCLENTVRALLPTLDDRYEVVVICFDHTQEDFSIENIHTSVNFINQELMDNDYVVLEDHPDSVEYVNNVHMNFGKCGLYIVQKLSKLNSASEQLKSKGYYDYWNQEELNSVVSWRNR